MTKWEYEVIPISEALKQRVGLDQKRLLDMEGKEGWELVSVVFVKPEKGFELVAYLKREKQ